MLLVTIKRQVFAVGIIIFFTFSMTASLAGTKSSSETENEKGASTDVYFSDNFTRSNDLKDSWAPLSGEWKVEAFFDRMPYEKFSKPEWHWCGNWVRLKNGGPEEWAKRCPNAFRYLAKSPDAALSITGEPTWKDYRFKTAAMSLGHAIGMLFGYQDDENYYFLRWAISSPRPEPSKMRLSKVSDGISHTIAETYVSGATHQWYKLEIATLGGRIKVFLDGVQIFDILDSEKKGAQSKSVVGKIGLYSEGEEGCYFDDVEVKDNRVLEFDAAQSLQEYGNAIRGQWKVIRKKNGADKVAYISPSTSRRSLYTFGSPKWGKYLFETRVKPSRESQEIGIFFNAAGSEDSLLFKWAAYNGSNSGVMQIVKRSGGSETPIASAHGGFEPDEWYKLQLDLTEENVIKVYVNDFLELRSRCSDPIEGEVGLYAFNAKGTLFDAATLRFSKEEDVEGVPGNIYVIDPFMFQWSAPRGAWVPEKDEKGKYPSDPVKAGTRTYYYKGDFFGRYSISFPMKAGNTLYFAAEDVMNPAAQQYSIEIATREEILDCDGGCDGERPKANARETDLQTRSPLKLFDKGLPQSVMNNIGKPSVESKASAPAHQERFDIILRRDGEIAKTNLYVGNADKITVSKDGRYIWVSARARDADGELGAETEIMSFRDDDPLKGRRAWISAKNRINPDLIHVKRNHIKDYLFQKSTADWIRTGPWDMFNRFDCLPNWGHLCVYTKSSAILWNKLDFPEDFTLEYYIGTRMQPFYGPGGWYPRPADLNAIICADGEDLMSGYSIVFSEWNPQWTERWSKILRKGEVVAQTDRELLPRTRHHGPHRAITTPYIAKGRDTHGAWYYIKIRKIGPRIEVHYDNELVMSYEDPEPLKGKKVGIWVLDTYSVMARAMVSYQTCQLPSVDIRTSAADTTADSETPKTLPSILVSSTTHPGASYGFENGLEGWTATSGELNSRVTLDKNASTHGRSSLRVSNIYTGGDLGVKAPIGLNESDPEIDAARIRELSFDYNIAPNTKINLYLKLLGKTHFIRITGLDRSDANMPMLGEIKGAKADGNWHHASFDLAPAVRQLYPFEEKLTLEELKVGNFHGGYLLAGFGGNGPGAGYNLDDFRIVAPGRQSVVLNWRPIDTDEEFDYSFVMDQKDETEPDNVSQGALTSKEYCGLKDGRWVFHIKARNSNGEWGRTVHYPLEVNTKPPSVAKITPGRNDRWCGKPIELRLNRRDISECIGLSLLRAHLNGATLPLSKETINCDWRKGRLTINPVGGGCAVKVESKGEGEEGSDAGQKEEDNEAAMKFFDGDEVNFSLEFPDEPARNIDEWYVIGPFENKDDEGLDTIYPPEKKVELGKTYQGLNGARVGWKRVTINDEVLDLRDILAGDNGGDCEDAVAYALAYVDLPDSRRDVEMALTSSDGVKLWINDKLVFNEHAHKAFVSEEEKLTVNLKKGKNKLFAKIDQDQGCWSFGLKVQPGHVHYDWTYKIDFSLDKTPPSRVKLISSESLEDGYPVNDDFEEGLGRWTGYSGGVVSRDSATAAAGEYSLKVFNQGIATAFGAKAFNDPLSVGKYPLLTFDYKIPSEVDIDLALSASGRTMGIGFADENTNLNKVGKIEDVLKDDKWHHAEMNLRELLDNRRYHPDKYQVASLMTGDWGYRANAERAVYHLDNFQLAPVVSARNGLKLAWKAEDFTGVQGYSWLWSDAPQDSPDEDIDTQLPGATFSELAEGATFFHIRAQDRAGNWGPTAHYRFIIDNTPPVVGRPYTTRRDGAMLSQDDGVGSRISIPIRDDDSRIDPASLVCTVRLERMSAAATANSTNATGLRTVSLPMREVVTTRDAATGTITWDWSLAAGLSEGIVYDGDVVTFSMEGVRDFAGNAAPPSRWSSRVVFDKDKEPPAAPEIEVLGDTHVCFDNFTTDLDEWANRDDVNGAEVQRYFDKERGDYCVQLVNINNGGPFSASIRKTPYDAAKFPYISFEYKFPKGVKLHVMAMVNDQWRVVKLTVPGKDYPNIGSAPSIVADDKWRATQLNLYDMLKKNDPSAKSYEVKELIIGDWAGKNNAAKATYYIDNFVIAKPSKGAVALRWRAIDPTGIRGSSFVIDQTPTTQPDTESENARQISFTGLGKGTWFFHCRAKDGAGNWGATGHCPVFVQ